MVESILYKNSKLKIYLGGIILQEQAGKKRSKGLFIGIVVAALVVLGGSVSAFFLLNKSPKAEYLLAETTTVNQIGKLFEDRYQNEVKWVETQKKKPVESTYDISAEWNDPNVDYYMQEIQSIVNNSKLSIRNVYDPSKKEVEVELGGAFGSVELNAGKVFVTPEKLMLSLPFADDLILFKDKDFGSLMKQIDPNYDGDEKLGLSRLFDNNFMTANELNTYIQKEYLTYFIEKLPKEAFTSEKETIEVFDKKIKAKKLSMKLSEDDVKKLMKEFFEKVHDDEKLKDILKESLADQAAMASVTGEDLPVELDEVIGEFEKGINEIIEYVDTWSIPGGIESTIWKDSNSIVKRDFAMSVGEYEGEETSFDVSGIQLLDKTSQQWAYTITVTDEYYDEEDTLEFTGNLTWDKQKSKDSIKISIADDVIFYEGEEKLDGKKRTFSRAIGYDDGYSSPKLIWNGTATHENDSVKANHQFTVSDADWDENMYNLVVKQDSKIVKKVDMPSESDKVVNIGEMSIVQIEQYIEEQLMTRFEEWTYDLMGDLEGELYNY